MERQPNNSSDWFYNLLFWGSMLLLFLIGRALA